MTATPDLATSSPPPSDGTAASALRKTAGQGPGLALLLAALVGGLAAWGVGEAFHKSFKASEEASRQAYAFSQLQKEQKLADTRNAMVAFGAFGGLLGLTLGLAGGMKRGSVGRTVLGGAVGLIVGTGLAVGAAAVLVPYEYVNRDPATVDLTLPLEIHCGLWVPIGLAAGLAYGVGRGGLSNALNGLIGGLIGAVLGTLAFELIAGAAFPQDMTHQPISATWTSRLLARLLVAVGTAGGIFLLMRTPAQAKPAAPVSA